MVGRLLLSVVALTSAVSAHDDQRYDLDEKIPLFVDSLVPENNPSETYPYYKLNFCKPKEPWKHKAQTLGEVLGGSRKIYSPYDIRFGVDVMHDLLCKHELSAQDVDEFIYAIQEGYHFRWYYDEIPLRGYVGEVTKDGEVYLLPSHQFQMENNRDRVIDAIIVPDVSKKVLLKPGTAVEVSFEYSVHWKETEVTFEDRPAHQAGQHDQETIEIQWFSIVNSCVLVVLLTGFIIYIVMKVLRKEIARGETTDDPIEEPDIGWKRLHADVFRVPEYPAIFASILGCGTQILLIFICMLTMAVVGVFDPYGRGTTYAAMVVTYSLTAVVAGYVSGMWYRKLNGKAWVHNVLITVSLFAGPVFAVWFLLNTVAVIYGSTAALPFGTICALLALYLLVTFPLTLAGAIAGKNFGGDLEPPTRTKMVPRQIPEGPWYRSATVHMMIAGFLPFSAIYVELYYVFITIWGHTMFTPYGILYLVIIILLIVTACITVALTYLQLSTEDHEWWWRSIGSGGSTAFFVFLYCFYFLAADSYMSGFMQLSHYFGYMILLCYALFLMLGSVGFFASHSFVNEIYKTIRLD